MPSDPVFLDSLGRGFESHPPYYLHKRLSFTCSDSAAAKSSLASV